MAEKTTRGICRASFLPCEGFFTGLAYIMRDFDNAFKHSPPEHTDAVLRQSVIRDWGIKINNRK